MNRIKPFDHYKPESLQEALALLADLKGGARVLAGGTDLLVALKNGKSACGSIVNLKGIKELADIVPAADVLHLGPLVTVSNLCRSEHASTIPILTAACRVLGTPQVRNIATVGGNLCNASPAADLAPPLLALEATVEITGPSGKRVAPIDQFFLGPGTTCLGHGEIVTGISVPVDRDATGIYLKHGIRQSHDLSIAGVAVCLWFQEDGRTVRRARIALGAVAPTPMRAKAVEHILTGQPISAKIIREASVIAQHEIEPISDVRSSAEYRTVIVGVLIRQALKTLSKDRSRRK